VSSKWSKGTGGPAGDEHYNLVTATGPVTHALTVSDGATEDGTGRGTPIVPVATVTGTLSSRSSAGGGLGTDFEVAGGLQAVDVYNGRITGNTTATITKAMSQVNASGAQVLAPTLTAANDPSRSPQSSEITQQVAAVLAASPTMQVRRLLPIECEFLQGFPADHTLIPWKGKTASECPDGPRYKAMGNSMAVPVMRWIGTRLDALVRESLVAAVAGDAVSPVMSAALLSGVSLP
jgi:DNA (cytosine-5)-methyltransferase 1